MFANTLSSFAPSAHRIQREGVGYRHGLDVDQLRRIVPAAFAEDKHESRSARYTYIPTISLIEGMRREGFIPVRAQQANTRDALHYARAAYKRAAKCIDALHHAARRLRECEETRAILTTSERETRRSALDEISRKLLTISLDEARKLKQSPKQITQ